MRRCEENGPRVDEKLFQCEMNKNENNSAPRDRTNVSDSSMNRERARDSTCGTIDFVSADSTISVHVQNRELAKPKWDVTMRACLCFTFYTIYRGALFRSAKRRFVESVPSVVKHVLVYSTFSIVKRARTARRINCTSKHTREGDTTILR